MKLRMKIYVDSQVRMHCEGDHFYLKPVHEVCPFFRWVIFFFSYSVHSCIGFCSIPNAHCSATSLMLDVHFASTPPLHCAVCHTVRFGVGVILGRIFFAKWETWITIFIAISTKNRISFIFIIPLNLQFLLIYFAQLVHSKLSYLRLIKNCYLR